MVYKLTSALAAIGAGLFGLYAVVAIMIAGPYYNWEYARAHGFMEWLLFGEVTATFDAFAWPAHLLLPPSPTQEDAAHALAAIKFHLEALKIEKAAGPAMPNEDWVMILSLEKRALSEAEQSDVSRMNSWYPEFGDHFKNEFIDGLRLIIDNAQIGTASSRTSITHGELLVDSFGDWYRSNLDGIRGGQRPASNTDRR
jgi:hypothetical protein